MTDGGEKRNEKFFFFVLFATIALKFMITAAKWERAQGTTQPMRNSANEQNCTRHEQKQQNKNDANRHNATPDRSFQAIIQWTTCQRDKERMFIIIFYVQWTFYWQFSPRWQRKGEHSNKTTQQIFLPMNQNHVVSIGKNVIESPIVFVNCNVKVVFKFSIISLTIISEHREEVNIHRLKEFKFYFLSISIGKFADELRRFFSFVHSNSQKNTIWWIKLWHQWQFVKWNFIRPRSEFSANNDRLADVRSITKVRNTIDERLSSGHFFESFINTNLNRNKKFDLSSLERDFCSILL